MWHLIRDIEGEPGPLIMDPRLHWPRVIDQNIRFGACKVFGWQYYRPRYMNAYHPLYLVERLWRGSVGAGCSPRRVGL